MRRVMGSEAGSCWSACPRCVDPKPDTNQEVTEKSRDDLRERFRAVWVGEHEEQDAAFEENCPPCYQSYLKTRPGRSKSLTPKIPLSTCRGLDTCNSKSVAMTLT